MSDATGFSAQRPELPGGGSVHGLGETFTPDPATGAGMFTIPLDLPAGPDGIGPELTLRYDTRSGDGPFGAGFSLPLPRILCSDGALALEDAGEVVTRPDGSLGLRVDEGLWNVARHGDGFLLTSRSGARHLLGTNPGGRTASSWHLERIEDALGNTAEFAWRRDGATLYPERVGYGPYELGFGYEARQTALRCTHIELRCPAERQPLVRRWAFGYDDASLLTSVTMTGFDDAGDTETAPVLRLSYTRPGPPLDWDGDALLDLLEITPARPQPEGGHLLLLEAARVVMPRVSHGVLTEIDNGLGLLTKIEYSTSIDVPVVRRITRCETTTGHVSETEFSYQDGKVTQDELGDEHSPTLRTVRWFDSGRMIQEETYGLDGSELEGRPYRRVSHVWTVNEDGPVLRPHQTLSRTTLYEREELPVSIVTTEFSEFDHNGNPCRTVEAAWRPGEDPVVLETLTTYATDPDDRFAALPARIRQFDGTGNLVADTVNRYDERPDGSAGTRGLITARESLVLTDALVADVYGPLTPDFTKYGYHRRSGENGWWITTFYRRLGTVTGLRGTITGPRGYTTEVRYSGDRCFAEVFTDPHGNVTTARHDPRTARTQTLTDPSGAVFTARYDPLARNEIIVRPGDSPALPTIRYRYDTGGPVRITTEQRAVSGEVEVLVTAEIRDGAGRLLQKRHSDHLGDVVDEHHEYCARGLVRRTSKPFRGGQLTPPAGTLHTEFRYDAMGRPLSVRTPDGTIRTFTYTGASVAEFDGQSALVRRTFTPTGRIASMAEQLGDRMLVSTYDHDAKGQLRRFTGADGAVTTTTYDLLGRVLRVASPAGTVVHILDSAGNPIESRTVGGHTLFRAYDACDRVVAVRVDEPDGEPVTRFTYHDAGLAAPLDAGRHTSGGRLCRVTDESGVTIFDYDAVGRPATKRSRPASTDSEYRLDLLHRADGQLSAVTFPESDGTRLTVHHQYDEVGRLVAVPGFVDGVDYDERGRRTGLHFANGVSELVEYDLLRDSLSRQVVTGRGGVLRDVTISTDRAGNVVSLASPDPSLTASYTYDSCYRLTSSVHNGASVDYAYDDAGNLTHKSDVGDFTYANHQLVSAGGETFGYDSAGNVTDAPWGSHIWDAFGRLRGVHGNDGTNALFGYDHTGRRVRTLVTGGGDVGEVLTPDELYAIEDGELVAIIAGAVRRRADGGTAFLHFDHLQNLVLVTDAAGAVVEQRHHDPLGDVMNGPFLTDFVRKGPFITSGHPRSPG